jgi:hypothetical protein
VILTETDRATLTLAIERARAQDAGLAQQIDRILADTDRTEVGMFAAACCQRQALRLKPWQIPPCRIEFKRTGATQLRDTLNSGGGFTDELKRQAAFRWLGDEAEAQRLQ